MARNNQVLEPQAKKALDSMKSEVASEFGIDLSKGYNGEITAKDAGRIGGNMVRSMIRYAQKNMFGGTGS